MLLSGQCNTVVSCSKNINKEKEKDIMKMQRMRSGLEVLDKLDGKRYQVVSVNDDGTGHAMEMDANGEVVLDGAEVTITEANALAFRILRDPAPYPIPVGYTVVDGALYKDGKPACESGEIKLIAVLAAQPDYLILTAKTDTEDMVQLMAYQVSRDRFTTLRKAVPADLKVLETAKAGTSTCFGYSKVSEKEEKGEDGNMKTVRVLDEAALLVVTAGTKVLSVCLSEPVTLADAVVKEVPVKPGHFEAFLPVDEEIGDDGYLVAAKHRTWIHTDGNETTTFEADGMIQADWSPAYNTFVIRTGNMVVVENQDIMIKSPQVAKLEGYYTLIDITRDGYEYRLTFSNDEYGFKTLTSKSTKDRGYIVTVD